MDKSRVRNAIGWILQILLAILLLLAASGKLLGRPQVIEMFKGWGFPDGFYLIIGVLELLGAVGLLIPRVVGYAASGLIVIMIGAAMTHLLNGEGLQVLRPLIFMLVLIAVVFARQPPASLAKKNEPSI